MLANWCFSCSPDLFSYKTMQMRHLLNLTFQFVGGIKFDNAALTILKGNVNLKHFKAKISITKQSGVCSNRGLLNAKSFTEKLHIRPYMVTNYDPIVWNKVISCFISPLFITFLCIHPIPVTPIKANNGVKKRVYDRILKLILRSRFVFYNKGSNTIILTFPLICREIYILVVMLLSVCWTSGFIRFCPNVWPYRVLDNVSNCNADFLLMPFRKKLSERQIVIYVLCNSGSVLLHFYRILEYFQLEVWKKAYNFLKEFLTLQTFVCNFE